MTEFKNFKASLLKDPNVRAEYEALAGEFALTDEQVAEVARRRADPKRVLVSHSDARKRIKKLGKGGKPHSASS